MATQKDLLKTAILTGAVEGMSMSEGVIDVAVPTEIPERGFSVPSPITGYCAIRVITTKGANQGGAPWFSLEHLRGTENFNGSWFATGGVATITPVTKGHEVRIATMDATVNYLRFIKVIGGGHKRYLPTLSRNRFGGALWLRLKTTSETLPRLAAGLPLRRQGGFLSRPLSTRVMERGDTKPLLQSASSLSNLSTQTSVTGISKTRLPTPILAGQVSASTQGRATCPVTRAMQSRTTLGAQTDKPQTQVPLRSTSFLLSVASNNARMEVAA